MTTFVIFLFSYWSLLRKFYQRNNETRHDKMHERALKLVYDDCHYLRFAELPIKSISGTIHQRNLHFLATEIFRVKNRVSTRLTEHIL